MGYLQLLTRDHESMERQFLALFWEVLLRFALLLANMAPSNIKSIISVKGDSTQ